MNLALVGYSMSPLCPRSASRFSLTLSTSRFWSTSESTNVLWRVIRTCIGNTECSPPGVRSAAVRPDPDGADGGHIQDEKAREKPTRSAMSEKEIPVMGEACTSALSARSRFGQDGREAHRGDQCKVHTRVRKETAD